MNLTRAPKKLTHDAIVDAVCEFRFECDESRDAPEIVPGILASNPAWKALSRKRLPAADIPETIRAADANLLNQATVELVEREGTRHIKFGPHSILTSRFRGYPGWETYGPEIVETAKYLFDTLSNVMLSRVGLRYVNVLEPEKHSIQSVHDLRFLVKVAGEPMQGQLNLNFMQVNANSISTVRIASREFVNRIDPDTGVAVVDIDTVAKAPRKIASSRALEDWLSEAHGASKSIFFRLFDPNLLENIVEEWE